MTEAMNEQNEYRTALDCVCRWKQAALDAKTFYELEGHDVPIRTTEAIVAYDTIRKSLEFMAANHEALRDNTPLVISIWRDGSHKVWSPMDASMAQEMEPDKYYMTIPVPTKATGEVIPPNNDNRAKLSQGETSAKQEEDIGNTSDGYHTFNELYDHRHTLFIALCQSRRSLAWRSKLHSDGTMFDGWFIAGLMTLSGNATYHLPIRLWDSLDGIQELNTAFVWDGHTSDDVLKRIASIPPIAV